MSEIRDIRLVMPLLVKEAGNDWTYVNLFNRADTFDPDTLDIELLFATGETLRVRFAHGRDAGWQAWFEAAYGGVNLTLLKSVLNDIEGAILAWDAIRSGRLRNEVAAFREER